MAAPLYESLCALAGKQPLRLHMPGHKGRMTGPFSGVSALDFTEIAPTGNLYTGTGPIAQAEALYASLAGAGDALFFTCGATQGIFTMLAAAVGLGGTLILDRACHKSVYHGMALLDIRPVYLSGGVSAETGLPLPLTAAELEAAFAANPQARAVLLTSPSYYGVRTALGPLAQVCRAHGARLLVDQAHGAHFPFVALPSAIQEGADLAVVSAHKTLPALGSSSILYVAAGAPWDRLELKALSQLFATTSPSYPILASMDYARDYLEKTGSYGPVPGQVRALKRKIARETPFRPLTEGPGIQLDPCRLTIDVGAGGLTGYDADRLLSGRNIYVEMADERYVVAIVTCCDRPEDGRRLLAGLKALPTGAALSAPALSAPAPVIRNSLRQALFGPREFLPLKDAAGRVSGDFLAPYPPGIPVVAPGEEITEKHIAYLQKKRYNVEENVSVCLLADEKEAHP